jgi:hypothetical protein
MAFTNKTFRISFIWHARSLYEIVQAYAVHEAIMLVQQRYPGATSFTWQEIA